MARAAVVTGTPLVGRIVGRMVKPMALGNDEPMRRNSPTVKDLVVQDERDLGAAERDRHTTRSRPCRRNQTGQVGRGCEKCRHVGSKTRGTSLDGEPEVKCPHQYSTCRCPSNGTSPAPTTNRATPAATPSCGRTSGSEPLWRARPPNLPRFPAVRRVVLDRCRGADL
jgi:hypothetical protein